jgi:hypothetical protein
MHMGCVGRWLFVAQVSMMDGNPSKILREIEFGTYPSKIFEEIQIRF